MALEAGLSCGAVVLGCGHDVPDRVVPNDALAEQLDTSDDWIVQRTGIQARRYVDFSAAPMGTGELGARAAQRALDHAGVSAQDIDCIIFATLSPDRQFPGDGMTVQARLDIPAGVPALDIRNQCSGFLYGLSVADAFIRCGTYRRVLLVGAEVHSTGLDFSPRGRDVTVLFGDGAGAVVLGPAAAAGEGVLGVQIHADGRHIDKLSCNYPSSGEMPRMSAERLAEGVQYPKMQGREVFRHAIARMPEALEQVLARADLTAAQIDLMVVHQANLRIVEAVQRRLGIPDDRVFNNIMRYGNTTAASIPIALSEAVAQGRLKRGDVLALASFGAGFTWGAAALRWA